MTTDEPAPSIARRLLAAESRVPLHHLLRGSTDDAAGQRLRRRAAELADAPLLLSQRDVLDTSQLRRWVDGEDGPGPRRLLVLDHLPHDVALAQLRDLRSIARDTGATVVAAVEQDVDDVDRQLRRLEQRADVLLELEREDQTLRDSARAGEADIVVHRHRDGPTDVMTVAFQGHYSRFVEMTLV